ncbi:MAG: hypothetical protein R3253_16815, partial [Longimicrobiales bacterium]|nr:hypothetical protein [Longimicrobiales bacterium]
MMDRLPTVAALGATLAFGCSYADAPAPDVEEWTVAAEPSVVIGALEGDSAYLFQEVVGATLLDDGGIVVADRGLAVIRTFDADGAFRDQMGGRGRGPGELTDLAAIWATGDTLAAWDAGTLRVTLF